ncbi:TonB-dependent receptor [Massilia sp. R2A-15]|uniref:TonB-dependent receptor n=1 Tax=Massilia sp. R2A-15 TaxID=3064278 RepID=UPI00273416AE|nr:TonB-dependent receptor [Massilia sp. R2A-15]WLI89898.1 TonB-dependent receptor [Massilia sp. R2A-15]
MITHKRIQLTKLALALSIALAAAPSFAQNTTSAIAGRISGPDGKPASGATVTIVHTESGSVSTVTTDAEGRYIARGLRTGGPYTITISRNGVTEKREGVFTQLAETASVDATIGAIQSVTVTGSAARSEKFSRSNMGATTNIGATELATQASIQRNLQDYARADPRVSQTDKERGELSVAGQNSRYNSMTIDGVAVNDTFGLEANGSPTARQPISIEAIQSVQVNVANYDVTQKGYTGANINAVTKSGTNDWKGGMYYVFRDDRLVGKRYNYTNDTYFDAPAFEETTKGGWVSGPLVQDKLFLFALLEEHKSTRTAPAFGPLGSPMTNVGITPAAIASAQAIAKNTYNVDIGGLNVPEGSALSVREQMIKVDWNISDKHRANLRYATTNQAEPIFPFISSTGLTLDSTFYSQGKTIETTVAQVFSDWTPNFSTELKASRRKYDAVPTNNSRMPLVGLQFTGPLPAGSPAGVPTGSRFLNFGTENSRQRNILGTDTQDLYAGANWSIDDHEIKFGTDYARNRIYNAFLQNIFGNYTFGCVNSSATYTYSFGAVNCSTSSQATIEQAVLENFRIGRPSAYTVQVAAPGGSLDNAVANFTLKNTGLFAQDTWNVSPALTLTYGVRIDSAKVDNRPLANAAAAAPMVPGKVVGGVFTRQSGGFGYDNTRTIDGQKLIQPRFGFNYKLMPDRNMQLRGGAGLFQGAAATVWMSNPFSNPGIATRVITCSTSTTPQCPSTGGTFSANPDTQPTSIAGSTPAANVDFLDPSLRQPSIWKSNLAFETELPWYGVVFGAEMLYTKNKDSIYYESLNLGAPTATGTDGRNLYYNANGLDSTKFTAANGSVTVSGVSSKALSNLSYGNVMLAKKTDLGDAKVLTLSFSRPLTRGLGWSVAYSRTDATEVSPLTSSVSTSNFNGRSVFNPNENVASNSSYLVKDRVNMLVNWQKKFFGTYNTRFGLFYEGRSGKPFSWTVNNDLNGDGLAGNDLMYIPKAPGSGDVLFYGDTAANHPAEDKFWGIVNGDKDLRNAAGSVVKRNGSFAPWTNSFDMRISQEIPGLFARNKASLAIDFLNFGNLLNKRWGHINEVTFQSAGGQARSFVDYVGIDKASGKYVYAVRPQVESLDIRQAKGESQWAIQATVKYEF